MNAGHRFNRKITGSRPLFNTHTYFDAFFIISNEMENSQCLGSFYWFMLVSACFFLLLYDLEGERVKEKDAKIPIHDSHLTTSTTHQSKETE